MRKLSLMVIMVLCHWSLYAQNTLNVQHNVQKGETLYKISREYDMTVSELRELNPNVGVLKPGMKLNVKKKINVTPRQTKSADITHTVEKGETLYGISKKYEVKVSEIRELNGMTDNAISIGQILKIPSNGTQITSQENNEASPTKKSNLILEKQQQQTELLKATIENQDASEIKGGIIEQRTSSNKPVFVSKSIQKMVAMVDTSGINRTDYQQAFVWIADIPAQQVVCLINPKTEKMAYAIAQPKQKGQSNSQVLVSPLVADKIGLKGSTELTLQYVVPKP